MGDGTALWFGASGFEVLDVIETDGELVVEVQTTATATGCGGCGSRARPKDRRWVTLRDAPSAGRPVLVRWRKRIWSCPEPDCDVRTWTEHWFATALFWKPQVALLVNARTFLPVLVRLAPAATLLDRLPEEISRILALHGVYTGSTRRRSKLNASRWARCGSPRRTTDGSSAS